MTDRIVKVVLRGDVAGLTGPLKVAARSVADTADQMTQASKESAKFRQGLTAVGDTAGKVGLVAAAGLGAIVAATANFDKAMSNVAATGDEARASLDQLREAAIQAGADTAFSASEAAGGIENLLKAGVSAQDVLGGGLAGALDLAAAGELEVADAAEIAATAMTQFKLGGQDVTHIADLLAAGAGKAQGDVSDLAMALKQGGLVAAQMGLSIEETTGTLSAFASAGLLGSDAGTSLKTMLLRLANPSAEASRTMRDLGIAAYDANGAFVGMESLAGQLAGAFEGQSQAQRDAAMATIFGSDAIRAASVLYSQGADGIADWTAKVDDSGYAAETAATRLDNLMGDLEALGGSLETALIGSGEGSQGALRSLVQNLTDVVNAYNELPGPAKSAATGILGVTAVAGGGLWAFSKVVTGIADTRAALDNLGTTAPRATSALKAVGKAATVVGVAFAVGQIADSIARIGLEVPGLEATTQALIDLANAGATAQISSDFDSLADSVDRLVNRNSFEEFGDGMLKTLTLGQAEGRDKTAARAEIEGLDAALADLVTSGNADIAADALQRLGESGVDIEGLEPLLTKYGEALTGVDNDARLAADGASTTAVALDELGGAASDASGEVKTLGEEMAELSEAFLDDREAGRAVRDSMREIRSAIKEYREEQGNLKGAFKEGTESGDKFGGMLDNLARGYQTQIDAVQRVTGSEAEARGAYEQSRRSLIKVATQILGNKEAAEDYVDAVLKVPDSATTDFKTPGLTAAQQGVWDLTAAINSVPTNRVIQFRVTTTGQIPANPTGAQTYRASGGSVIGPGTATSDSIPAWLSNGEHVWTAAEVAAAGGQEAVYRLRRMVLNGELGTFAKGGAVGMAKGGSVDDRLEVLRIQQQINDIRKDLAEDGKDSLKGIARAIAEAELEAAKRDLRRARRAPLVEKRADLREQMGALRSIELDVEGGATVAETREALREFRKDVRDAGGEWTKQMAKTAHGLIDLAKAQGDTRRSLERETVQRDRLAEKLDEQIRVLEDVKQAMESYSASVSGNFLTDPFGGRTLTATGGSAAPGPNPALAGTMASLADAQSRLAGIRASGGDPLDRSYRASKVVAEIAELERQADDLGRRADGATDAVEQTVDVLEVLRETLLRDVEAARAMNDALATLSTNGLNPGLYQQLAASGDVDMASALASLGASDLAEINALWAERQEAAAQVATLATQQVFGAQLDAATKAVQMTEKTLARQDKTIERLNNRLENLGDRVEKGAERGVAALGKQIQALQAEVRSIPRELETNRRKR